MAEGRYLGLRPLWLKSKTNDILMLLADFSVQVLWMVVFREHRYIITHGGKHLSFTLSFGIESKIAPFTKNCHH